MAQKPKPRRITKQQYFDELIEKHGSFKDNWACVCPKCGNVQTIAEFKDHDIDPNNVNYACIGRYVEGRGCDFVIDSLVKNHPLEVIMDDQTIALSFEIA